MLRIGIVGCGSIFQTRFGNAPRFVKSKLGDGTLGKVISARVVLTWCKDYWGHNHIRQIADFYDAIENDREPEISGKTALKIQKLICDIYEKGRENFERN